MSPAEEVIVLTRRTGVPNQGAWYVAGDGTVLVSREAVPPPPAPDRFAWQGSSTGVLALTTALLDTARQQGTRDLHAAILPELISRGLLRAFDNGMRYFLDYGTPERLARLAADAFTYRCRPR